ncbi:uncharacterized protein LOC132311703 isoform X2 [Cornus florida]|uniref:uncharacterized protein LOC132311703 isoform X2 n=1 Tax=Cornus florida TaxID=4283 RepID=UPI00289AE111|nr:uncharacterized protein LOC132311703 isoform X2 [Cornus florida]
MSKEESSQCEGKTLDLLNQFELILEADPLIDEVGFIHPSQFVSLNEEAGGPLLSSVGTVFQSADGIVRSKISEANSSDTVFWSRDHKLGISTQVLFPLYNTAKHAFMVALEQYKTRINLTVEKDESSEKNGLTCYSASSNILESEVMKHSRALLLLSSDFGTAWNSRKLLLSNNQHYLTMIDELLLSSLVLSYSPKSESAWSHRRWVIKMIAGKCSNLQEIVEKESELVKKIAEKSKMNYRAWNHRCWLVSYMSRGQVLHELNKSRDWAGLHVADNSCFHYRAEELEWDEKLIKLYIGRESLWLHRRFLLLVWIKHFATDRSVSCHLDRITSLSHNIYTIMDNEMQLFRSCSTVLNNDFEDFQAQATLSATYILWLTKQICDSFGFDLKKKLQVELKIHLIKVCPEKTFLWDSLVGLCESI